MQTAQVQNGLEPASIDQRVFLRLDWGSFERLLKARGESSGTRLTYTDGVLELMSPSFSHEYIKTNLARLLEAWAIEEDEDIEGYGSWTIKSKKSKKAVEPDECYTIGPREQKQRPDLALEVMWTDGGLDKREIYHRLQVPEVWLWGSGTIQVYGRRPQTMYACDVAHCCRRSTSNFWRNVLLNQDRPARPKCFWRRCASTDVTTIGTQHGRVASQQKFATHIALRRGRARRFQVSGRSSAQLEVAHQTRPAPNAACIGPPGEAQPRVVQHLYRPVCVIDEAKMHNRRRLDPHLRERTGCTDHRFAPNRGAGRARRAGESPACLRRARRR